MAWSPDGTRLAFLSARDVPMVEMIALLIEHGADSNLTTERDIPPLHRACQRGDYDVARALLAGGASVDAGSKWREDAVSGALQSITEAYRAVAQDDTLLAWAGPDLLRLDRLARGRRCASWPTWLLDGSIDRVLLEGPWQPAAEQDDQVKGEPPSLYGDSLGILGDIQEALHSDAPPLHVPTVPLEFGGESVDVEAQVGRLREEGPVTGVALTPCISSELAEALAYFGVER